MHRKSYIKMDESMEIKSIFRDFDIRYCIICQKKDSKWLASTANGRSKLIETTYIRKYEVWNRLESTCVKELFVYHVDNQTYEKYLLKKRLLKILRY